MRSSTVSSATARPAAGSERAELAALARQDSPTLAGSLAPLPLQAAAWTW